MFSLKTRKRGDAKPRSASLPQQHIVVDDELGGKLDVVFLLAGSKGERCSCNRYWKQHTSIRRSLGM
jgi:hypothetical protein